MNRTVETAPRANRVLVVEDEPDVVELLRYHLGHEGYAVLIAPTGGDVVRRARDARPDLILLDVMLPQLNGWDVCRRLKAEPETRGIPVITRAPRAYPGHSAARPAARSPLAWSAKRHR